MDLYGFDIDQVSKKSGLSRRVVAYYVKGERVPNIERAEQLAEVFGLEGWHLILPNLPSDINQTKHLNDLVNNYIASSRDSRELIDQIPQREAKSAHE